MTVDADRVVYSFPKSRNEEVRATLNTFNGKRYAHVRVYVADENDVDRPTKRGIALKVDDLPKLLAAVEALIEAERAA